MTYKKHLKISQKVIFNFQGHIWHIGKKHGNHPDWEFLNAAQCYIFFIEMMIQKFRKKNFSSQKLTLYDSKFIQKFFYCYFHFVFGNTGYSPICIFERIERKQFQITFLLLNIQYLFVSNLESNRIYLNKKN